MDEIVVRTSVGLTDYQAIEALRVDPDVANALKTIDSLTDEDLENPKVKALWACLTGARDLLLEGHPMVAAFLLGASVERVGEGGTP